MTHHLSNLQGPETEARPSGKGRRYFSHRGRCAFFGGDKSEITENISIDLSYYLMTLIDINIYINILNHHLLLRGLVLIQMDSAITANMCIPNVAMVASPGDG